MSTVFLIEGTTLSISLVCYNRWRVAQAQHYTQKRAAYIVLNPTLSNRVNEDAKILVEHEYNPPSTYNPTQVTFLC